ncbi:MAG TPA: hypothetical protein EYG93_08850 [Sulfurospirillum arcachonense]|nr:hypothetical protein [Sulfurospirillum arcachonense]HIP45418.1 hypothetical protein [Sulfurospirillum arcachonense]
MTVKLSENIKTCKQIFVNCDIDYEELVSKDIDETFFEEYQNTRIVNSFLFNFSKLQDKIGAKLFKDVLYELKEIDDVSMPMIDILNRLETLSILDVASDWDSLREIRNALSYEYPFDIIERVENINLALAGYVKLKSIFKKLVNAIE